MIAEEEFRILSKKKKILIFVKMVRKSLFKTIAMEELSTPNTAKIAVNL